MVYKWRILRGAYWLLLGGLLVGCAASVSCPGASGDGRSVFLLDHKYHPTLALTDGEGRLYRYGYGDWRFYAEGDTGFFNGVRALFWPTSAALGHQVYEIEAPTKQAVDEAVGVVIVEIYHFKLPAPKVDKLGRDLEQLFQQGVEKRFTTNTKNDLVFAAHPRDYTFWHNSNHEVAGWLSSMGCDKRPSLGIFLSVESVEQ